MLKSLITALTLATLAAVGFAGIAQAHHKVGHCFPPGVFVPGCPITPQQPQPGK